MNDSTGIIIICLLAFAIIHSITASFYFKKIVVRVLGSKVDTYYLHAYNLVAIVTLAPVAYFVYTNPGETLYVISFPLC